MTKKKLSEESLDRAAKTLASLIFEHIENKSPEALQRDLEKIKKAPKKKRPI